MTQTKHWTPSGRAVDEVDKIFRSLVDEESAPGVSYGVVDRDGLVHAGGHGAVHEEGPCPEPGTAFRVASVTKSFTAASIMILVRDGALSLVDPVARYVPEFGAVRPPTTDSAEVTVGMLLSMAGGLPTDDPWADRQESMTREEFGALLTGGIRFVTAPGTAFEYSNLGYALLGCVVEAASGLPYREFVDSRLLAPLGMTATGFDTSVAAPGGLATGHVRLDGRWRAEPFSGPGVFSAIGGLFSTVDDLGLWVRWLADAFPARDGDDPGPLPRALRREMQQARRAVPVRPRSGDGGEARVAAGYGYGLVAENHEHWGDVVSHSGGYPGFGSHIRWHPETGLGVVALANGRYAPCQRKAAAAMEVLLSEVPRPVGAAEPWPETIEARAAVDGLLRAWDPAVARAWFAGNVEMDLDLAHRRAEIAALVDAVGPLLDPGADELIRSDSAAHAVWRVPGAQGALRCEIRLAPQSPPRIQTLRVARLDP